MIKIAVDAMGGDYGIQTTIPAAMKAVKDFKDIEITLYGDEAQIKPLLTNSERIHIVNTTQVLDMGEHDPVKAIRNNRDSSMVCALRAGKNKEADAVVSNGPTQCLIVGAHLVVRKLEQMSRVALCPIIPSFDGKGRLLLDVGANVELKPNHLHELAVCASIVAKEVLGVENPTVGILNIGEEKGKGRLVDQETYDLFSESKDINFYGNVEPNFILTSDCTIFLTDGFTGNMVMKGIEGTAKTMGRILKQEIKSSLGGKIGYLFMRKNLKRFAKRMDTAEVGGAMVLGVGVPVIKCHGSSKEYDFYCAIRQARVMVMNEVVEKVKNKLSELTKTEDEGNENN
ncbi:MAG: phosphate acyltransferase PlsX [Anaeroplasmataceae bacterium]